MHHPKTAALFLSLLLPASLHAAPPVVTVRTSTGTFTPPAGVTSIQVECWGGGGGGGGVTKGATATGNAGGGGGGGGAYAKKTVVPVTPLTPYAVTIPAAAAGGSSGTVNGVNGSAVTFTGDMVSVTANGGTGGTSANATGAANVTAAGGAGGATGSGLDAAFKGGDGKSNTTGNGGPGGAGASDLAAGNDAIASSSTEGPTTIGSDANHNGGAGAPGRSGAGPGLTGNAPPGGAGSGAKASVVSTSFAGSVGARGQIIITYYPALPNPKANNTDPLNLASSWKTNVPAPTDIAAWDGTVLAANTTVLGNDLTFGGVLIQNPGGLVTINPGNTLTLGAAATDIDMTDATADLSMNNALALGAANVWDVKAFRTLTIGGIVSGPNTITKSGSGAAVLTGNNTYSDITTISAGTLNIQHANALGDTLAATSVSNSAGLLLQGGVSFAAEPLNLASGASTNGALRNVSGDNTWTGPIGTTGTLASARISSDSGLLTVANTVTGNSASTLVVLQGAGNILVSGQITGTSPLTSSNLGAGIRTLSSASNNFIGTVSVNGGTLAIAGSGTLGNITNNLTLGGGQLGLGASSQTVGSVSITVPAPSGDTIANGSLTGTSYAASNTTGTAIISANLLVSGSAGFTKTGIGAVTLSGNNTYTGTTAIGAGKINALHANALGNTAGDTTITNGATLALQGGISYAAEPLSVGSGGANEVLLQSVSGNNTWNGTIGTTGTSTLARISSDADLLTLANTITGSDVLTSVVLQGAGNILVSGKITGASGLISGSVGAGTRTLSNTGNDFGGRVAISGGKLALGASDVLPNVPISIAAGTLDAAAFTDIVGTLTVTGLATINLGTGGTLAFADSNGLEANWTGTLNITGNFVSNSSIKFATTGGLTAIQLGKITVNGGVGPFTLNATGHLIGPTGGNYQSWATANGVTGGVSGDSDNDGVSNLVEYALANGGERGVLSANAITFTKRGTPFGSDITYGIEISETLASGSWSNAVIGVTEDATLISYTFSPNTPLKNFARLKITQIP